MPEQTISTPPMPLRHRLVREDLDVLRDLRDAVDTGLSPVSEAGQVWARPMDIGGGSGSTHSYRLRKLAAHGYVQTLRRGNGPRGSLLYTITDAGRQRLLEREARA